MHLFATKRKRKRAKFEKKLTGGVKSKHILFWRWMDQGVLWKIVVPKYDSEDYTAQKMKFSIKDFLSKCDQIHIYWRNSSWKTSFFMQCQALLVHNIHICIWKRSKCSKFFLEPPYSSSTSNFKSRSNGPYKKFSTGFFYFASI